MDYNKKIAERISAVADEMESLVLGYEDAQDSPVMHWADELRRISADATGAAATEAVRAPERPLEDARAGWRALLSDLETEGGACGYLHAPNSLTCEGCRAESAYDFANCSSCDAVMAEDVAKRLRKLLAMSGILDEKDGGIDAKLD